MNLKRADLGVSGVFEENRHQTRILQVKAKHFNGLKLVIALILSVSAGLTYTVKRLHDDTVQKQQENSRLLSQISVLRSEVDENSTKLEAVTAASDSSNTKALGYIESIQRKLRTINDYLGKRGLKSVSFYGVTTAQSS